MTTPSNTVVLIDFDNYFKKDINDYNENEIEFHLDKLIQQVLKKTPEIQNISLRLYGGWFEGEHLSKKASTAMQLFSNITIFPIHLKYQNRLIHGDIEFVTELIQIPRFKWYHTFKERAGTPHIRINKEHLGVVCENSKDICPVFILSRFTKSKTRFCKVSGCTTIQKDVFFIKEQKMVDTLIACDIINLFENQEIQSLFLISEDLDHLPAVAFAGCRNNNQTKVYLCISNENLIPVFNSIMSTFNIEIIILS
ncbi:MAG: hypothetical protein ABSD71_03290 [Bacteroidales bacterium]|jgi:uncharacterized LabA/DUF88 family protein